MYIFICTINTVILQIHIIFNFKLLFTGLDRLMPSCKNCNPGKFLLNSIPVLRWLPKYKWKTELVNDLIAGFTVAIMHIPQGEEFNLILSQLSKKFYE